VTRFFAWLRQPPASFRQALGLMILVYFGLLAFMVVANVAMVDAGIEVSEAMPPSSFKGPLIPITMIIAISAIFEELIFRAPLYFVARLGKDYVTLAAMLVLSIIFGLAHGNHDYGHLILQGTFGLVISIVFLKLGAIHRDVARFDPLTAVVLIHFLFDMTLIVVARLPSAGA
jgi:hypothetical protein